MPQHSVGTRACGSGLIGDWRSRRVPRGLPRLHEARTHFYGTDPEDLARCGVPMDGDKKPMRPAVLMFDDEHECLLKELSRGQDKYQEWEVRACQRRAAHV